MIDWDAIIRDDGPVVWRTCFRLLANRADADECFQEVFADAVMLARKSAGDVRSWRAMLIRLATARAVDRLRQRVRRSSREAGGMDVVALPDRRIESRPEERAENAETAQRLRVALAHLPPKQADAFCLHCLEGFSYREVSEQMNESVDHIGVLISRARAELRVRIGFILSEATTGVRSLDNRLEIPPSTPRGDS
jgi:RNA polymerase sigma-70 factor (ECF subfamily)